MRLLSALVVALSATVALASAEHDIDVQFHRANSFIGERVLPQLHATTEASLPLSMQQLHAFNARVEALPQLQQSVNERNAELQRLYAESHKMVTQADPSTVAPSLPGCISSVASFVQTFNRCTASVVPTGTVSPSNPFSSFTSQMLQNICSGTCQADVKSALSLTMQSCGVKALIDTANSNIITQQLINTVTAAIGDYNQITEILAVGCITDDNNQLCLPQFFNSFASLKSTVTANSNVFNTQLTTQVLDGICSPCMNKIATKLAAFNGVDRSLGLSLSLLCAKETSDALAGENKYCVQTLAGVLPTTSNGQISRNAADIFRSVSSKMCSSCFRRLYTSSIALVQLVASAASAGLSSTVSNLLSNDALETALDSLCVVNEQAGQRCIDAFALLQVGMASTLSPFINGVCPTSAATTIAPSSTSPATLSVCPEQCRAQVQQLLGPIGCCLGSLMQGAANVPALAAAAPFLNSASSGMGSFLSACGVDVAACGLNTLAPLNPVIAVINIPTISFEYYTANKAIIDAALKQDLVIAIGVASASLSIEVAQAASGNGIDVKVSITVSNNADGTSVAVTLNAQLVGQGGANAVATGVSFPVTQTTLANNGAAATDAVVSSPQGSSARFVAAPTNGPAVPSGNAGATGATVNVFSVVLGVLLALTAARQ